MRMAVIRNLTRQAVLADRAELASGLVRRIVGLLSRSSLRDGEALIFPRCSTIHTCFMRFPIDVLFLRTGQGSRVKGQGVVVKVVEHLKPFRFAWAREADTVIELPAGTISRTSTHTGELLEIAEDSIDSCAKKI